MSKPERIPEWANIDTVAKWLDVIDNAPERDQWIREALLAAYARGREDAAKVCLDMAEEITSEEIPYHKREERSGAIVREMQSRRCAAAIRAGGA